MACRAFRQTLKDVSSPHHHKVPAPSEAGYALARVVRQTTEARAFVIDALVAGDGDEVASPMVLFLGRPDTLWFDLALEHVLDEWAEHSEVIRLTVKRGRRGAVAVLEPEGGDTSVRLDLLAVR
jgi:hypothetical protein